MSTVPPSRTIPRRWILATVIICVLIGLASALLLSKPQEISDLLLRSGGRIINGISQRPGAVAGVSAAFLGLVWITIGLRCLLEDSADATGSSPPNQQNSPTSSADRS